MQKWLAILIVTSFAVACGGGTDKESTNNDDPNNGEPVNSMEADAANVSPGDAGGDDDPDMGVADTGAPGDMTAATDAGSDAEPQSDMNTTMPLTDPALAGDLDTEVATATADIGGESIDLTIHLPVGDGPYPIVVFHHGFLLGPDQYASYGAHLASHGYVVVMPAMPGSAFDSPTHVELSDLVVGVLDWIEDDVDGGTIGDRGDPGTLALAGHSLGGKISLLTASRDARPVAVFGVDPVDSAPPFTNDPEAYPSVAPELMPDVAVPVGLLGETVDSMGGGGFGMACAPAEENFQQYYMAAASPVVEVEIVGADHMDFLDDPDCGFTCSACGPGSTDEATVRMYTRRYMTAFFDLYLKGVGASRTWLAGTKMDADVATGDVVSRSKNGF